MEKEEPKKIVNKGKKKATKKATKKALQEQQTIFKNDDGRWIVTNKNNNVCYVHLTFCWLTSPIDSV
jgi:hypothetical protein